MTIHEQKTQTISGASFTRRVLIAAGIVTVIVVGLLFLQIVTDILLLVFAGILLAVFLRALTDWVSKYTGLADSWSLVIVVLAILVVIGLGVWLLAAQVAQQIDQLIQTLPSSLQQLRQRVMNLPGVRQLLELDQVPPPDELVSGLFRQANLFSRITGIFSTLLSMLTAIVVILAIGLYLAAEPGLYERGIVRLIPISNRDRARQVLGALGYTLRWWLVGRIASMVIIGVFTGAGLWLLGMPLALTLGLLAGLLEYIPNIGPVLSAVPAVLIASTQGQTQVLYVVALYLVVQALESYVVTPLVLEHTVSLPPVLTLTVVIIGGILFGFLGLLLATPLTVVVMVLVKMLYIEDTLGDPAELPGPGT
jgi:predicted PurR-regulated permease PerM